VQGSPQSLKTVLSGFNAYTIPPYQRAYQWDAKQWHGLVHDVLTASTMPEDDPPHWLGILLLSDDASARYPSEPDVEHVSQRFTVIDGQQRLVTTTLWLAALKHHAEAHGQQLNFTVESLSSINVQEADKKAFAIALNGSWLEPENAVHLEELPLQAYAYFRWLLKLGSAAVLSEDAIKVRQLTSGPDAPTFDEQVEAYLRTRRGSQLPRGGELDCATLLHATRERLSVFTLIHQSNVDQAPAAIFDRLNGFRTELQPLDHVRNSIFVRFPETEARDLYIDFWRTPEERLRALRLKRMSAERAFLYDYLIARGEKKRQGSINSTSGATHFSAMTRGMGLSTLRELLKSDLLPAMACWPIVIGQRDEYDFAGSRKGIPREVARAMQSIREFSRNPANPYVMHFLQGFVLGRVSEQATVKALFRMEAYLARLTLAKAPMNGVRARIMELMAAIDGSYDPGSIARAMSSLEIPSDGAIKALLPEDQLYKSGPAPTGAILRGIERQLSGSGAMFFTIGKNDGDFTVEHIYPQTPGSEWDRDLAAWSENRQEMQKRVHSIGNLTVVTQEHNSAVGSSNFHSKIHHPIQVNGSAPLRLNDSWLDLDRWTSAEIDARSEQMIAAALKRWSIQSITGE